MAFLDELPLDILLAVVKRLSEKHRYGPVFYELLPVASVSASLRQVLLPLLYRDLILEFPVADNSNGELIEAENDAQPKQTIRTRHNAALASSAGCSAYAQRVVVFVNECTTLDDIVRAVRDDMDAGSETKWPDLQSYTYNYVYRYLQVEDLDSCTSIIRQLGKELPKLRQASPVTCDVSSGIASITYNALSASFLTQLTSLSLSFSNHVVDTNRLPQFFAPSLVNLILEGVNPEDIWSAFYSDQEGQTVVFARLKCLAILFERPLWGQSDDLPSHLQGTGGKPGCRVPLFPVLRTLRCTSMTYSLRDFISRTQCHNSLVSLYVDNGNLHFDFDAELFKNLETVKFDASLLGWNEESASSVDLYKSVFTGLLHAKTSIQRMAFKLSGCDTIFQVPPNIGCVNLRLLVLGVEVDFKSMLRLLGSLKHLVELELYVDYDYIYARGRQEDTAEYIDELQPPQAEYPPVSSTLRRFMCRLCNPRRHRCYTASYALELALHLPALESMPLSVDEEEDVEFYKALLGRFLEERSGSPYMNDGLLNARVFPYWQAKMRYCWEREPCWD
ncbi:hypothetical protein GQ54DRAFT_170397 [Martensiomyces pterosporus]|nr:hypothetical protein GQ54DRAFT_170397 [Martensiomyces pterosporus]